MSSKASVDPCRESASSRILSSGNSMKLVIPALTAEGIRCSHRARRRSRRCPPIPSGVSGSLDRAFISMYAAEALCVPTLSLESWIILAALISGVGAKRPRILLFTLLYVSVSPWSASQPERRGKESSGSAANTWSILLVSFRTWQIRKIISMRWNHDVASVVQKGGSLRSLAEAAARSAPCWLEEAAGAAGCVAGASTVSFGALALASSNPRKSMASVGGGVLLDTADLRQKLESVSSYSGVTTERARNFQQSGRIETRRRFT